MFFYTLLSICAFALWRGGKDNRLYSSCVLGVFLADRILLASGLDEGPMIFLGGVAEFIAFIFVFFLGTRIVAARVIGFLFAMKMIIFMCLLSGMISFGTMAAWTETASYLQLIIIAAGAANVSGGNKRPRNFGHFRHGASRLLASYKGKVQAE